MLRPRQALAARLQLSPRMTIRTLSLLLPLITSSAYAYAPPQVSDPTVTSGATGFLATYGVGQPYDCKTTSFTSSDCSYHQYGHNLLLDTSGAIVSTSIVADDSLGAASDALDVVAAGPNGWLLRGNTDAVFVDGNGNVTAASSALAYDDTTWVPTSDGWWNVQNSDDYSSWNIVHTGFDGSVLGETSVASVTENPPVVGVGTNGQLLVVWSDDTGFYGQLYDASANPLGGLLALGGLDGGYEVGESIVATSTGFLVLTTFEQSDSVVAVSTDGTVTQNALPDRSIDDFGNRILTTGPQGGLVFDVGNSQNTEDALGPLTVMQVDAHGAPLESPRSVLTVDAARLHIAAGAGGVVVGDTHDTDVRISQLAADGSYIAQAVLSNPGPSGCSMTDHGNASPFALLCVLALVVIARRSAAARRNALA